MVKIAILIFVYIFTVNMIPAVATRDTAEIEKAAGRTTEQITDVTNEVIKEITIDTVIDKLVK